MKYELEDKTKVPGVANCQLPTANLVKEAKAKGRKF
jgi:hypothetical protein